MTILRPRSAHRAPTLALALYGLLFLGCTRKPKGVEATAERGTVQRVVGQGASASLEICDPQGNACAAAIEGAAVPAGSLLRTGPHASAELAFPSGSVLSLDHDTELSLPSNAGRHARLTRGSLVVELAQKSIAHARFDASDGTLELASGKASLRAGDDFAILDVVRGSGTITSDNGKALTVNAGEEARLYRGSAPYVSSGAVLSQAVAFTENLLAQTDEGASASKGLGELTAKKPGSTDEVRGVVKLAAHHVKVRIAGAMARTEIDEVFENSSADVLEGIYRFPIPAGAKIERLASEVDGKLEEGAFVDRDRAASIWRGAIAHAAPQMRQQITDDIVWVPGPWRDPALLEWQRGGRFELRIFPIPKHGQRRIVLAYTEAVQPVGGVRRFTYPLPVDPGGTTKVRHFDLDVEVRGQDPSFGVRTLGYPLSASDRNGARALSFSADDFSPNGDLSIEWALPERQSELSAFGYRAGDERYALLTLRPKLPRATSNQLHATAIVVDSSRSMYGEGFERAKKLAARLGRELDPAGTVTVLACDSTCRQLPGEMLVPGPGAASTIERFLAATTAEGASDLTQAVATASRALGATAEGTERDVIYIGDGTPTVGPIRPATVTSAVRDALTSSRTRVTGVAVGAGSDLDSLAAIARAGGGLVLPYVPGQTLSEASLGVLSATYGSALRDIEIVLPDGLQAAAPEHLDTILSGSEASIGARMSADNVDGSVILRGKLGNAPFEQRYPVHVSASDNAGNAFVPRLYAAARIADLEQNGGADAKREALSLSTRFSVASRYTSLLVLESEAMFQAFGLEADVSANRFTGEDLADKSDTKGELAVRILGSVVDVRPDDVASQKRLARLYRWSGRADLGCRHAMAIAELRANDPKLLADALRCARGGTASRWASEALGLVDEKTAHAAEALASAPGPDDTRLLGDLRVEATWSERADLDLALLHPDGHRVSWLGAPTRELITARDVLADDREGLALSGAKPGEYTVEIVRSAGSVGPVHGELTIFAAGETRRVPFTLDGERMTVAIAEIKMMPRLIPLQPDPPSIASDF